MAKREGDMQLIGYTDVAGFAGIEDGEAVVRPLEVSVNKEVAGLPTKYSQRIHGERIEVYKRQLPAKSSGQMSAVEKQWKEVQKPFEHVVGNMASPSKRYDEPGYQPEGKQDLSPLGVLKNMVDNHANDIRSLSGWVKLAVFLGAIGLCAFVIDLAVLTR